MAYAFAQPVPVSADAAYYLMVAENLYHGHGLLADYVWNYLAGLPGSLPVPANEYWMPGTSVMAALTYAVAGEMSLRAAQLPELILGALLCALTAWIGGRIFGRRDIALISGGAAAVNFYLVGLSIYPDHFMLNAVLVNLSLLALWLGWRGSAAAAWAAGIAAGLGYLVRTDGGLLIAVALVLGLVLWRQGNRRGAGRLVGLFLLGFCLVAAPWWVRQTLVFGSPSGANPMRTAFLTDYNDLFRLDQSDLTLGGYLATSQVFAVLFKGYVLFRDLRILAKAAMLTSLLALGALAFRSYRRPLLPWTTHLALGVIVPPLLVPYPAAKGGFWHLMPSLCPVIFVLAAALAVHLVTMAKPLAGRRGPPVAWVLVLICFTSLGWWWIRPPGDAAAAHEPLYPEVAVEAVLALGPSPGPVLTDNAWGLYHAARVPCAQFPTDGPAAALRVADSIGAQYLVTRADAPDKIPAMAGIIGHPRFQPLARYPIGDTALLVYRIVPNDVQP